MTIKIIDNGGEWLVNKGVFAFEDPETKQRFEPGFQYKVKVSDWLQGQIDAKVFEKTDSPDSSEVAEAKRVEKTQAELDKEAKDAQDAADAAKAAQQTAGQTASLNANGGEAAAAAAAKKR